MSTQELARTDESVSVRTLGEIFVKSGFFKDTRDQYQAVVKILYGRELGFSPVVSMMGINIIDGKPSITANLLGTLVKRSGRYNYRVTETSATRCEIAFFEINGAGGREEVGTSVFTIEDAKQAGLMGKRNWQQYPKAMLFARALSAGVKLYCPDVSASPLYVPEELGAEVNEEGEVTKLPKSAASVEVIEKDIELGSPVMEAARSEEGVGNQPGPAPQAPQKPFHMEVPPEEAFPSAESPAEGPYISVGQTKNFHAEMRKALKARGREADADNLTYKWLLENGYYDKEGSTKIPTASRIPAAGWLATRDKAVKWAGQQ